MERQFFYKKLYVLKLFFKRFFCLAAAESKVPAVDERVHDSSHYKCCFKNMVARIMLTIRMKEASFNFGRSLNSLLLQIAM